MVGYETTEGNSTIGKLQLITNLIQIYKIRKKTSILFSTLSMSVEINVIAVRTELQCS